MSDCLESLSAKPLPQPTDARAARLKTFWREQRIVEYLNRGVSVAEIAAQVGVGEKRLRAVIREILARRMPHPPEEFVAIQMSRLNEALLVAFSAMSPTNLKAVDQVVKIVRELDRYGGAFAAEWARPAASRLAAPAEEDVAFAKAWLGDGELAEEGSDDRPENLAQSLEKVQSAPGNPLAPPERGEGWGEGRGRLAAVDAPQAPHPSLLSVNGEKGRREILAQRFEKIESAPGNPLAPPERGEGWGEGCGRLAAVDAPQAPHPSLLPVYGEQERPENPTQSLEKVKSAPGIGLVSQTAEAAAARPVSSPDLMLTLLRSAGGRGNLRACLSRLRPDTYGAPPDDGEDFPFAAPAGCAGHGILSS